MQLHVLFRWITTAAGAACLARAACPPHSGSIHFERLGRFLQRVEVETRFSEADDQGVCFAGTIGCFEKTFKPKTNMFICFAGHKLGFPQRHT